MKNTKKIITLALAAAMLSATGITAFAAPITANSNPKTGGTTVNYQVAPVYTVVIPESVTLGNTKVTEQIKIYGATANDNVVIGKKQKVNVALTASANDFKVKTADGETIAYTVNDKNAVADLTTVAECAAGAKQNTDITFKKTGETKYAGTYTDTLTFTVSLADAAVAVTGVTLNKTTTTIGIGKNETLTATVAPDDATDKTVTWTSSDESVATVDSNGKVTAVASGTATITATIGGKSATCVISVEDAAYVPKTFTSLSSGDVLRVGDTIDFDSGSYDFLLVGFSLLASNAPFTVLRGDWDEEAWEATENENGAYYVIKDKNGLYYKPLAVTSTSDGIKIVQDGNYWGIAVNEPS